MTPTREQIGRILYECEKKRGEHADAVMKGILPRASDALLMEPWEECKDSFLSDADAVLGLFRSAATSAAPIAFVPVHPRHGELWTDTYPADSQFDRSRAYEQRPLYGGPTTSPDPTSLQKAQTSPEPIELKVEEGGGGLWYVTSEQIPGLLVAEQTHGLALNKVGHVLWNMQKARVLPRNDRQTGEPRS